MHRDTIAALLRDQLEQLENVRSGLDVGFAAPAYSQALRDLCGGVWVTVAADAGAAASAAAALAPGTVFRLSEDGKLPFDDDQFDVAVLNGALLSVELVREVHRVLAAGGLMLFTVPMSSRKGRPGYDRPTLYNIFLRHGFDVIAQHRSPWWRFGVGGRTLTVCGRKKTWRTRR